MISTLLFQNLVLNFMSELDSLELAEFKQAFDEFDKVYKVAGSCATTIITLSKLIGAKVVRANACCACEGGHSGR